jgi:acyl carrier protein
MGGIVPTKNEILEVIVEVIESFNGLDIEPKIQFTSAGNALLFDPKSSLDSLALVTLVLNIEDKLSEKFGLNITLADDRAMSQKNSPFRTTESLTEYIFSLENAAREL